VEKTGLKSGRKMMNLDKKYTHLPTFKSNFAKFRKFLKISAHFFSKKVGFCPLLKPKVGRQNPHEYWVCGSKAHFPTFFLINI
jgi:hypothetical protein